MGENQLSIRALEALRHIRTSVMNTGKVLSVRELMKQMGYKSPRSALLLMQELEQNGFLKRKTGGGYSMMRDLKEGLSAQTVDIPLVGTVTCGLPILAHENIEAMIQVSTTLAKPGNKYFMLRAKGDSMDAAGINDGDLVLVRQQSFAENGEKVVALIDNEATVKEFHHTGQIVRLVPRSNNSKHQPIILTDDFRIQGVVVATIPNVENLNTKIHG